MMMSFKCYKNMNISEVCSHMNSTTIPTKVSYIMTEPDVCTVKATINTERDTKELSIFFNNSGGSGSQ